MYKSYKKYQTNLLLSDVAFVQNKDCIVRNRNFYFVMPNIIIAVGLE